VRRLEAELISDARAQLGEGPIWDARTGELLWVDIMAGMVHRLDPETGADRSFDVGQPVGAVVPRASGGYAFALRDGFAVGDDAGLELVAPVDEHRPDIRMNDGACDPLGRFWAGTMHLDETRGAGALYRLDPDGRVETVLTDVTISNGVGWCPDAEHMYYVDTPTRGVDAFDFDAASGAIENRRRLATIEEGAGMPDGLVVDAEGCLWVALWEGWAVRRYSPEGELLAAVAVPAARVTKAAFGGTSLDRLYVTTAMPDAPDPAQPHAGGVFAADPGVHGLPPQPYAG
jgi:sugar lactone lactonase YvrE